MAEGRRPVLCVWVEAVLREQLQRGKRKRVTGSTAAPQKSNLTATSSIYWRQEFDERMRGHGQIRDAVRRGAIEAGWGEEQIRDSWKGDLEKFNERRKLYLLYKDF